jgi:hypothetical protein
VSIIKNKDFIQKKPNNSIPFLAGFLLGLFFDPEDGGDMFLRNGG